MLKGGDALKQLVLFAQEVMTNVGAADLLKRVDILKRGTGRKAPTDVERAALKFLDTPTYSNAIDVMVEIGKEGGVRTHRPGVLHACIKTFRQCSGQMLRLSTRQQSLSASKTGL